ncbi:MAG TPA: polysaccharide pyruvyl transferase family protein [Smithellaceae bacterium]|nr:polysaccharide pyruvyl transferase family protein [Smithellaceae bacterium]
MKFNKNSNKKIGILTFHFTRHNYGAVLQTYASFNVLKKLGYQPQIINLLPKSSIKQEIYSIMKRASVFEKFRKRYFSLTDKYYHDSDLSKLNRMFDVFYVGSDQIWRPSMAGDLLAHYYLDFADDEKLKIAYAVSFGTSHWEGTNEETEMIRPLIKRFKYISVREAEGVEICNKIFNVNAVHVLDPTLLLTENDYPIILGNNKANIMNEGKYMGAYLLADPTLRTDHALNASEQTKLKVNNLYGDKIKIFGRELLRFRKVEEWLNGIKNASFVITDSYHCIIFCIIMKTNFVCLPNETGGVTRIKNMLNIIGLEERFCADKEVDFGNYYSKKIDFDSIYERLRPFQNKSLAYLSDALQTI